VTRAKRAPGALHDRLRARLQELDLSLSQAAAISGIPKPTIGAWVTGDRKPDAASIRTLALALGVSPIWLQTGEGTKSVAVGRKLSPTERRIVALRRLEGECALALKATRAKLRALEREQADALDASLGGSS
jgi:transcriptional regulator with XRE-family HTH domain